MSNQPIEPNLPSLRQGQHGVQPYTGPDLRVTLLAQLSDPATPMEIRKDILAMMERLEDRHAKMLFDQARAELRPHLPVIKKNGLISYGAGKGSSPFAKWDDIHRACMPLLDQFGFSCTFSSDLLGTNALKVTMTVKHTSGHEDHGSLVVPWLDQGGSKSPAQAAASSFTIAQRHVFVKYFNILTEDQDDDGSGKGVAERITEEQGHRIEDILAECDNRKPGTSAKFIQWIKAEMHTDNIAELFQGPQLDSVMSMLRQKMASLGVK